MVKIGDTVVIDYSGSLEDGTVFDSTAGFEPFEFKLGEGQIMAALEKALLGMEEGETKEVFIPAAEAYGPYRQDRIVEISRNTLPPGLEPRIGQQLAMEDSDGETTAVTVVNVSDTAVKINANNPLAGHDVTFQIRLLAVKG